MSERALIKSGTGVSKAFLKEEVESIKRMLDELIECQTKDQLKEALGYCKNRVEALKSLVTGF